MAALLQLLILITLFCCPQRDTFITKPVLMQLLMWYPQWNGRIPVPAIVKPQELWTGKQVFSMLLPDKINVTRFAAAHDDKENDTDRANISAHDTKVLFVWCCPVSGSMCCIVLQKH